MYKIINDKIIQKGNIFFPRDELNRDYQQFKADVVGIGTTCVEGETVSVATDYAGEYPNAPYIWKQNKLNQIEVVGTSNIEKYSINFELSN